MHRRIVSALFCSLLEGMWTRLKSNRQTAAGTRGWNTPNHEITNRAETCVCLGWTRPGPQRWRQQEDVRDLLQYKHQPLGCFLHLLLSQTSCFSPQTSAQRINWSFNSDTRLAGSDVQTKRWTNHLWSDRTLIFSFLWCWTLEQKCLSKRFHVIT